MRRAPFSSNAPAPATDLNGQHHSLIHTVEATVEGAFHTVDDELQGALEKVTSGFSYAGDAVSEVVRSVAGGPHGFKESGNVNLSATSKTPVNLSDVSAKVPAKTTAPEDADAASVASSNFSVPSSAAAMARAGSQFLGTIGAVRRSQPLTPSHLQLLTALRLAAGRRRYPRRHQVVHPGSKEDNADAFA